jgi:hypothetical protein
MAMSGRVAIQECDVEVLMPSLGTLAAYAPDAGTSSLENIALQAAESGAREVTDVYVGETVFLLVVVRGPEGFPLQRVVGLLDDVRVSARPFDAETAAIAPPSPAPSGEAPPPSPSPKHASALVADMESATHVNRGIYCGLTILRESSWVNVADPTRNDEAVSVQGAGAVAAPTPRKFACKGLWVIVRSPLEPSALRDVRAITGKQRLSVSIRERKRPVMSVERSVHCSVELAARISGAQSVLVGSKVVTVHLPLDLTCRYVECAGNSARSFVSVTARNTTSDATVSIVPPYVHLSASMIVDEGEERSSAARTSDSISPRALADARSGRATDGQESIDNKVSLDEFFKFKREFGDLPEVSAEEDDDVDRFHSVGDDSPTNEPQNAQDDTGDKVICEHSRFDDFDVFIPSFGRLSRQAVHVGPREVFEFVFAISPRDNGGVFQKSGDHRLATGPPKLEPGKCFFTPIAIAWACRPRAGDDTKRGVLERQLSLQRERTLAAVLAIALRSNVAIQALHVHWTPPSLVEDIVLTFSGPPVAAARSRIYVSVTIMNQGKQNLNSATLYIQRDAFTPNAAGGHGSSGTGSDGGNEASGTGFAGADNHRPVLTAFGIAEPPLLLPLRTVIGAGPIPAGCSANVLVPCVAHGHGIATLGDVRVIDATPTSGFIPRAWRAKAEFQTFVVDPVSRLPGDPEPPVFHPESAVRMASNDMKVISL